MANPEHLAILKQGVEVWNKWRKKNPRILPDLSGMSLRESHPNILGINLSKADFRKVNLRDADLYRSWLIEADFSGADLSNATLGEATLGGAKFRKAIMRGTNLMKAHLYSTDFYEADLTSGALLQDANLEGADLRKAKLIGAYLTGANMTRADLSYADLTGADLGNVRLIDANLEKAIVRSCRIHGISAWNLRGKPKHLSNLIITQPSEQQVAVDNLEVAQFVYLLLNNENIRNVIDTIGKKGVLILGRFTEKRKTVLDAIRNKLRELGFVPMMFDFEKPTQRDFTETIKILAGMCRFIIADITNPKSSPLELQATMPDYMIPFVPIIQEDEKPFAMFQDLKQKYGEWVLDLLEYDTAQGLLDVFYEAVVAPAKEMAGILELKKAEQIRTRHVKDYKKTRPFKKAKKRLKA